jgi:Yip1-like protein
MTESTSTPMTPTAKPSFWEDVIDIFFQPSAVFRRRQNSSVWPPMLFVALSIAIIFFITFNTLEPLFDAEFNRQMAKAMAKNPQLTADVMEKGRSIQTAVVKYGLAVVMIVTMFVLGCVSWLIGKLFDSKQTFQAGLVVAAWAYMPRIIGGLLGGVQGLLMDPASLTGQLSISLSPARFMDPETPNQLLYQFLGRFDLITIWVTVLLAIGLHVTGKVPKGKAAVFGVVIWLVGALPALRQALV